MTTLRRRFLALAGGGLVWLPTMRYAVDGLRPEPEELAARLSAGLAARWGEVQPDATERSIKPEWDFMGRTFTVLALANEAEAKPPLLQDHLVVIDRILEDTLEREAGGSMHHFLLPYGRRGVFRDSSARSIFIDGEILLMLAARELLAEDGRFEAELRRRVGLVVGAMERGPVLSGESYPDECWTFCNTTALAGLAVADAALGEDHSELGRSWVDAAKRNLLEHGTGLMVSSYHWDGQHLDGPEGSSLWMSAHNLLLVDEAFARDQFVRARRELSRGVLGFGWSREWSSTGGARDVDSGPVVPLLEASPGASGMAVLGASAFGDETMRDGLLRSLELAAFPIGDGETVEYAAAGSIGTAVVAYALHFGPLWKRVAETNRGVA